MYRLARELGLPRLPATALLGLPSSMPEETRTMMALLATSASAITASAGELTERATSDEMQEAVPSLGELPLVLVAAGQSMDGIAFWPDGQRARTRISTVGRLVFV